MSIQTFHRQDTLLSFTGAEQARKGGEVSHFFLQGLQGIETGCFQQQEQGFRRLKLNCF